MVRHHEAADTVCRWQVRGLAGQSHLDAGGTPGDEVGQFPLPDPLQALVDLVGREQRAMGRAAWSWQSQEWPRERCTTSGRWISAMAGREPLTRDKQPCHGAGAHAGTTWSPFSAPSVSGPHTADGTCALPWQPKPSPSASETEAGAHLRRIHLPLDDVEDGDVAVVGLPVPPCGHHHVLGLQQSPHHVQDCGFPHTGHLPAPAEGQREQARCSPALPLPGTRITHTRDREALAPGMEPHTKPHAGQGNPEVTQEAQPG